MKLKIKIQKWLETFSFFFLFFLLQNYNYASFRSLYFYIQHFLIRFLSTRSVLSFHSYSSLVYLFTYTYIWLTDFVKVENRCNIFLLMHFSNVHSATLFSINYFSNKNFGVNLWPSDRSQNCNFFSSNKRA